MAKRLYYLLYLLFATAVLAEDLNLRPIIGILDQPAPSNMLEYGETYIPAAYVKWLESAGARVVPIPHRASPQDIKTLFQSLNAILFTGGGLALFPNTTFYQTSQLIYNLAVEANNNGDYFPLWGTCQGFQLLSILTANDPNVLLLNEYDSENLPLSLDFTSAARSSRMFGNAPEDILNIFKNQNVTINLHHDGVLPETYTANSKLASNIRLLSTNVDRNGKPFGSALEGTKLPFYATQFHPERNAFEWNTAELTMHTSDAMRAMQYLADFFVSETRKNHHQFNDKNVEFKSLIYNYAPMYTLGLKGDSFPDVQTYLFTNLK